MVKNKLKTSLIDWLKQNYINFPPLINLIIGKIGNSLNYKYRYGKDFYSKYREIKEYEYLQQGELNDYILNKLIFILNYSYNNVPFYKKYYKNNDIKNIKSFDDFSTIPIIDKNIVRDNQEEFLSKLYKKDTLVAKYTSGSTGEPLKILMPKSTTLIEWAFILNIWERIGYNKKSKRLAIREIADKNKKKLSFDYIKNELKIDVTSMDDENLKDYCNAILKYKPDFIHGYPSGIITLCQYIERNPIDYKFKGVLTSSEGISDKEQDYIMKVLDCPLISFYGHTERLVLAGQCRESKNYHVEPLYGYCELVDEKGALIHEEGVTGEIVATGFCNEAMPLIRYRTGDLAQWGSRCDKCGREYKILKKIEGRKTEFLVDKKNIKIPVTAFNDCYFADYNIKAIQYYQIIPGEVIVNYIPNEKLTEKDLKKANEVLNNDSNNNIDFKFVRCNQLIKKSNGKKLIVIQKIKEIQNEK